MRSPWSTSARSRTPRRPDVSKFNAIAARKRPDSEFLRRFHGARTHYPQFFISLPIDSGHFFSYFPHRRPGAHRCVLFLSVPACLGYSSRSLSRTRRQEQPRRKRRVGLSRPSLFSGGSPMIGPLDVGAFLKICTGATVQTRPASEDDAVEERTR